MCSIINLFYSHAHIQKYMFPYLTRVFAITSVTTSFVLYHATIRKTSHWSTEITTLTSDDTSSLITGTTTARWTINSWTRCVTITLLTAVFPSSDFTARRQTIRNRTNIIAVTRVTSLIVFLQTTFWAATNLRTFFRGDVRRKRETVLPLN